MKPALDALDRKILEILQQDTTLPLEEIATKVGASKTPVWNRIKKLRSSGVIRKQVALLDPDKVGVGSCFYVLIRTSEHESAWLERFLDALKQRPEIMEAHRLAGDVDYILKVRVRDAKHFDQFYRALVSDVRIFSVTSLLSMEELIGRTEIHL